MTADENHRMPESKQARGSQHTATAAAPAPPGLPDRTAIPPGSVDITGIVPEGVHIDPDITEGLIFVRADSAASRNSTASCLCLLADLPEFFCPDANLLKELSLSVGRALARSRRQAPIDLAEVMDPVSSFTEFGFAI